MLTRRRTAVVVNGNTLPAAESTKPPPPPIDPDLYASELRRHDIRRALALITAGRPRRAHDLLLRSVHTQARVLGAPVDPPERYPTGRHAHRPHLTTERTRP